MLVKAWLRCGQSSYFIFRLTGKDLWFNWYQLEVSPNKKLKRILKFMEREDKYLLALLKWLNIGLYHLYHRMGKWCLRMKPKWVRRKTKNWRQTHKNTIGVPGYSHVWSSCNWHDLPLTGASVGYIFVTWNKKSPKCKKRLRLTDIQGRSPGCHWTSTVVSKKWAWTPALLVPTWAKFSCCLKFLILNLFL